MLFRKRETPGRLGRDEHGRLCEAPPPERLRTAILQQAVREKADAILLEPTDRGLRIRYRLNGFWNETMTVPQKLQPALTISFREAAGLSVTASPRFDVGLLLFDCAGADYEAYVSFLPTGLGERMAVRLSLRADTPTPAPLWDLLQL